MNDTKDIERLDGKPTLYMTEDQVIALGDEPAWDI